MEPRDAEERAGPGPARVLTAGMTRVGPIRWRVLLGAVAIALLSGAILVVRPRSVGGPPPAPVPAPPTGGNYEAQLPVDEELNVAGPVQLVFDGLNGSVSVQPGASGKLEITAVKSADGSSPADATEQATKIPLSIRQAPGRVIFSARTAGALPWSAPLLHRVDYQIIAPEQAGLTVTDGYGTIDAAGLHRPVDIAGEDLAVQLTDVGAVSVAVNRGSVVVDGTAGATQLDAGTGQIQAEHLAGPSAMLNADAGVSVIDSGVTGVLAVSSKGTPVSLQRARGREIDVQTRGGAVQLTDVTTDGALKLDSAGADVTAERVLAHPLAVTTTTGLVDLSEVQGNFDITTSGAPVAFYQSTASSLAVSTRGGDVYFGGRLPTTGATAIDTGGGKLQLVIPRQSAFTLDANADRGRLTVDPALLPAIHPGGSTVQAPVNGGGARVVLRTHGGPLSVTTR